ncbi:hypothetical protein [Streptomyces chattanoogensis]|uniref:Uncharacterized protein n=1 Tax=Streptomyces chattanoogensis TaxID=66876 RepID=A0A0N1JW37_9ACTN|nr:hypothetical protein [Streptomyces chattanoogensis]KPC59333.1 hypothetical protein ADL29_35320 [Streptomyces chattanoogensis]
MTRFDGALIEFCQEQWSGDGTNGLALTVRGRTAEGRLLAGADAQCSLAGLEDIDLLVENCGCPFVSEDGMQDAEDLLATAFPGADVRVYETDEEPGPPPGATRASPLWEYEVTWETCESCSEV